LTRLLQLPNAALRALQAGKISEGHARAILALKQWPTKQEGLLGSILNNGWTVRQAEQYVSGVKLGASSEQAIVRTVSETALTKKIGQKLGAKVNIKHTAKGGQLIIHFSNEQELQQLAQKLQKTSE
jgi:ParB family chromosome partitioning protein